MIGLPDDYWVEKVHAVVVLKEGGKATAEEIIDFCKQRLARFKAPKSIEFVKALPKSPAGKILKRELRDPHWAGRDRLVRARGPQPTMGEPLPGRCVLPSRPEPPPSPRHRSPFRP